MIGQKYLESIADNIVSELAKEGIESYIWHKATTGSVYIRFKDPRMCSVRIANHPGRAKLKYKYNLRSDTHHSTCEWRKQGSTWRHYLWLNAWKKLIPLLVKRRNDIASWPNPKFNYIIPKHKR